MIFRYVSLRSYREAAGRLFEELAEDTESKRFHPHPLTAEYARQMDWHRDIYELAIDGDGRAASYGILRGWDEGYVVPSLGIAVAPYARGRGIGYMMMEHLHACALSRGCFRIRLKVYPDNEKAIRMYRSLGYRTTDDVGEQLLMIRDVTPSGWQIQ